MHNKKSRPSPLLTLLFLLLLAVAFGLPPVGSSAGAYDPRQRSQGGEWVTTGRADNLQEYCDTNFAGTLCAEWCEGLDFEPTGVLCCIPPESLGYPGKQSDCNHYLSAP